MGKHQLFKKIPPKDLVVKLLNCLDSKILMINVAFAKNTLKT